MSSSGEVVCVNPCQGLPRKLPEPSRSRYLSEDEIVLLFKTLDDDADLLMRNLLKILLLTAQQLREVTRMRWNEIGGNIWTIPAERAKNRRAHRVHLSRLTLVLLEQQRRYNGILRARSRKEEPDKEFYDELVFPSHYGSAVNWVNHRAREIVAAMDVPRWTPHDLRRTAATHMADLGVDSDTIEAILNHRPRGVAGVYQRASRFRDSAFALERWARHIERIIAGKEAVKVVSLR